MRILKQISFAAIVLILASSMSFAQRGHRLTTPNTDSNWSMRWHPRIGSHFGLSDSCWNVFLSQIPADTAHMLTEAFADIKVTRARIDTLHKEYRAALRADDTVRARLIWIRITDLFKNIRDDWDTIQPILRQYHELLIETRRDCDHNGRKSTIGLRVTPVVPNPATTNAHFSYTINAADHVLIQLFDQSGTVVKTVFEGNVDAGEHDMKLDLSGMQSGAYLVRIQAGPDVNTLKLVIRN